MEMRRDDGVVVVEDMGSHNGTWLAGARLTAPLPVGDGIELAIGREIPCSFKAEPSGIAIDLAGERTLAPLGPLVVGGLRVALARADDGDVVTLEAESGAAASLGDAAIETAIELARGDVVRVVSAGVPHELRVVS